MEVGEKSDYVEWRPNGDYYVRGIRITLASVVFGYKRGETPVEIQEDFPCLKLSQIYGAIAWYLDHSEEFDAFFDAQDREIEANTIPLAISDPGLHEKYQQFKAKMHERAS